MNIDLKQHQAEAAVIMCVDFRFIEATQELVKTELNINNFDLLTVAGVAKPFAENLPIAQEVITTINNVCVGLHQIKKIVLLSHHDCGAYGGSQSFPSINKEEQKYKEDLNKAKEILNEKFPNLEIIKGIVKVKNNDALLEIVE